jgi:regulator of RNase E activity RraA
MSGVNSPDGSIDLETAAWKDLSTATISDALDRLSIEGQCFGLKLLSAHAATIAGEAFTVRMAPVKGAGGTVGDYIDDVPPGAVVVIDNQGRTDVTVWGELLTTTALERGVAGTVIDGCCRDSAISRELDYPIFSRGSFMRTGKGRVRMEACQVSVTLGGSLGGHIGGVRVEPGDVIVGDADGVVVVSQGVAAEVLEIAREIERAEKEIRLAVRGGSTLQAARARHSYHCLQSVAGRD